MLLNFVIGLSTMSVCLMLQSALLAVSLRYYVRHKPLGSAPSVWRTWVTLDAVMTLLVLGNLAQLVIWAIVFRMLGEFAALDMAG